MILTSDLNPTSDYTRVLNEAIFDERLGHAEFRLWCMLLALPKGQKMISTTAEEISQAVGLGKDACRVHRRNLKAKGFLVVKNDEMIVTVPSADFEPQETKLTPEQQLRHDLRDAWNNNKPEAFSRLRHPVSEAQVETLKLHAEHNKETDLCKFLGATLKGCKADDWWKEKNLNFGNVFGTGTPKQNKFTNVEKLFKLANSDKAQAALFDESNDQCWLDWYHSKGQEHMTRVVRIEMERYAAWDHQKQNAGDGVIYVYTHDHNLVHWTGKEGQYGLSYLPTAR